MAGVAVKETEAPTQIVVELAVILTPGINEGLTAIVIELDVAVAGKAQVKLDVMMTLTTSPFAKVLVEYIAEFVPTLTPFTCH